MRNKLGWIAVTAAALAVTACSDDSDGPGAAPTTEPSTTEPVPTGPIDSVDDLVDRPGCQQAEQTANTPVSHFLPGPC